MDDKEWKVRTDMDISDLKIRMSVAEASLKDVKEDIKSIKDDTKWLRRTISAAIITSVIGGLIGLYFFV